MCEVFFFFVSTILVCSFFFKAPDKPPQNVSASNLTSEARIPVSWGPVPEGHVNGLLIGYSIKYQRIWTAERAALDTEEENVIVEPSETSAILQVQTYSVYRIKVAAFTRRGMGPYSEFLYAGEQLQCVVTFVLRP